MQVVHQLPHPALAPYVRCYWEITHSLANGQSLDIPFGCTGRTHWLITLRNTYQTTFDAGGQLPIYDGTLVGQITRPITQHIVTSVKGLLIDFTVTGLHNLWDLPIHELHGQHVEVQPALGTNTGMLVEQLRNTASCADRFALVDAYLLARLRVVNRADGRIEAAVRLLEHRPGHVSVRQLAEHLNFTERTLNRRFTETVGVSPKLYARIQRFLQTRRWLEQHPTPDWHDLLTTTGYYDQAHLINEFKSFTGKPPRLYGLDHKPLHDFTR